MSVLHGRSLAEEPGVGALTIAGYLREVTEKHASREAVVFREAGNRLSWTYAGLWQRSVDVARALVAAGVGRDSRVGILMTNRPEYLAAIFGIALAGGVSVPLNTFATPSELKYLLAAPGISVLLFERSIARKDYAQTLCDLDPVLARTAPESPVYSARFPFLRKLVMIGDTGDLPLPCAQDWDSFLASGAGVSPDVIAAAANATGPADTAMVFFSSGTTNLPKGMIHAHRAIALQWWRWPWVYATGDDVRAWTSNGFFWSGPFSLVIGSALSSGGAIILQSAFDADEAVALLEEERVTLPIARRHQWARMESVPHFAAADLSSLRYVDTRKYLQAPQSTIATDWHDPRAYGATETLTNSTTIPSSVDYDAGSKNQGPPLPGNIFKIVEPQTGVTLPLGERGEIALKGPTLMLGYLGKTLDQTFDDEGFFRTGDAGWLDGEGNVFWDGRMTDMIKTGGANVAPDEVDRAIAAFPGIRITQTVGVPDEMFSEIVVSCIVPRPGHTIDEKALRAFLKERLASYKIPKRILYFRDDEVSLTSSGAKVKAAEMRRRVMEKLGLAD